MIVKITTRNKPDHVMEIEKMDMSLAKSIAINKTFELYRNKRIGSFMHEIGRQYRYKRTGHINFIVVCSDLQEKTPVFYQITITKNS